MKLFRLVVVLSILSPVATYANSGTTYQYRGNPYHGITDNLVPAGTYSTSMRVSASFTVAETLGEMPFTSIDELVTNYSFYDGVNALDETNSNLVAADFSVSATGQISEWQFAVSAGPISTLLPLGEQRFQIGTRYWPSSGGGFPEQDYAQIFECVSFSATCIGLDFDSGLSADSRGTWSISVIPEPSTMWLSGFGLLGFIGVSRHKRVV